MDIENQDLYIKAIDKWGVHSQINMWVEESGELTDLLMKFTRGRFGDDTQEQIAEEIADVEIMLDQLKVLFKIDSSGVEHHKKLKIESLKEVIYAN